MRPRVYIETTIPSFYHAGRTDVESAAKQILTRRWWRAERASYDLVTSAATIDELAGSGRAALRDRRIRLLDGLGLLAVTPAAADATAEYIRQFVMPAGERGDALHLALASVHACDFLLTWNCRHLANANKTDHIALVNRRLGLHVPKLVTPEQLSYPELS